METPERTQNGDGREGTEWGRQRRHGMGTAEKARNGAQSVGYLLALCGCVYGGPSSGSLTTWRAHTPGTVNSVCPTSHSR